MRKLFFLAGLAAVGLGLVGWATLTTANPADGDDQEQVAPQHFEIPDGKPISRPVPMPRGSEPAPLPERIPANGEPDSPLILPPKPPAKPAPVTGNLTTEKPVAPPVSEPIG